MPGYTQRTAAGYLECEYAGWPGIVVNQPANAIPPGAAQAGSTGAILRGRLQNQPGIYPLTGNVIPVTPPVFAQGENVCLQANLQAPGQQQGFTVLVTNIGVYIDYVPPTGTSKTFTRIFTFPNSYPRYARFGAQVIGNVLYFSSSAQRGVYALMPQFPLADVQITNGGGYFSTTPTPVFSDGAGAGAVGTATVSGGVVTAVTLSAFGSYLVPPLVTFQGGGGSPTVAEQPATAVGILAASPSGYVVKEISALTGVAYTSVTAGGSGYVSPQVVFQGGGGAGAQATAIVESGVIVAIVQNVFGQWYTSPPTVEIVDPAGTGAAATATLFEGKPFIGGDFLGTFAQKLLLGNIIGGDGNSTVSVGKTILTYAGSGYTAAPGVDYVGGGGQGAAATTTESGGIVTGITQTAGGTLYYQTPSVQFLGNATAQATAIAQLSAIPQAYSTDTRYPDRIAWSAPNAYGYFDPNFGTAPGGYSTLTEARGLIGGISVFESAAFIGHNGGFTEMIPNAGNTLNPWEFVPMWASDQVEVVRYGSMAQLGALVCFLSNDSAWMLTPNGVQEIGMNIAALLQDANLWNNGDFPLQGVYSAFVAMEGEKHYLVILSSDDWDLAQGNAARQTVVFDYNVNEQNWSYWNYPGVTATCGIYQSFDTAIYEGADSQNQLAHDQWLLFAATVSGLPPVQTGPVLDLTPSGFTGAIPFHYVAQHASVTVVLPIVNPGTASLTISAATITGTNAADFVLNGFTGTLNVPAGTTNRSLSLTFTPTAAFETVETATLTLTSNAASSPNLYPLSGISANPGTTAGPYSATPVGYTASVTALPNTGEQTDTSSQISVFPSEPISGGQIVTLAVNFNGAITNTVPPTGGGGGEIQVEISEDGGATWIAFYTYSASTTTTYPPQTQYENFTSLLNLDQLQVRAYVQGQCGVYPPSGEVTAFLTINSVSAMIITPGDVYCSIQEQDSSSDFVPPVLEWGVVTTSSTYASNTITLSNPTQNVMTVAVAADTANGYSIINQAGSTTLGPNNANQFTFQVQLIPPSGGSHDDAGAVVITIPGQAGTLEIESYYTVNSAEMASIAELATVNRAVQLSAKGVYSGTDQTLNYQFRVESPAIARLLSERRLAVEYENLPLQTSGGEPSFSLNFTLTGQQTPQLGASPSPSLNVSSLFTVGTDYFNGSAYIPAVLTLLADFGTFAGVCTSLGVAATGLVSLVRLTQASDLPQKELT